MDKINLKCDSIQDLESKVTHLVSDVKFKSDLDAANKKNVGLEKMVSELKVKCSNTNKKAKNFKNKVNGLEKEIK
ncbi:hypothetical protein SGI37_20180, partial [Providencia rettgeri]